MHSVLRAELQALARTQHLLVACDYDGTLAELVDDPSLATPHASALEGLRGLAPIEHTTVAVVSGRSLKDLDALLGPASPQIRIGSHGAEWTAPGVALTPRQSVLLAELAQHIATIAIARPGTRHEVKPAGVALHTRGADPRIARDAVEAAVARLAAMSGVNVRRGHQVIEFMVVPANKGEAVIHLKNATGATGVLFVGDDLTDEDVFRVLTESDVGVKVGDGQTDARHRIAGVPEVGMMLREVGLLRRAWAGARRAT